MRKLKLTAYAFTAALLFPVLAHAAEMTSVSTEVSAPVVEATGEININPQPPAVQGSNLGFLITSDDSPLSIVQEGDDITIISGGNINISGNIETSGSIVIISMQPSTQTGGSYVISNGTINTSSNPAPVSVGASIMITATIIEQPAPQPSPAVIIEAPKGKEKKEKPAKTEASVTVKGNKVVTDKKNKK